MSDLMTTRKRILVTEDDPNILRLVATILRHAGYDVETATGGQEALTKISQTSYDALVLDLMMPDVSGFEVLARIPLRVAPFVIVMSAAAHTVVANVVRGNVFAALHKPFDVANMVETVRACLAGIPVLQKIA
jgi:DNA-binding response OmpR family regulator